jgi:two-component system NtrC family sensor kinase
VRLALKFTAALIVGIIFIMVVDDVFNVRRQLVTFKEDMNRDNIYIGRSIADTVSEIWTAEGSQHALQILQYVNKRTPEVEIRWTWLEKGRKGSNRWPLDDSLRKVLSAGKESAGVIRPLGEFNYHVIYVPVVTGGREVLGALELSESLAYEHRFVQSTVVHVALASLWTILTCSGLALLLGVAFVGRPMRRLVEKARRVGSGDFSGRLDLHRHDELDMLAREMNQMSDRLSEAHERIASETVAKISAVEQLRHADRLTTVGKLASGIAHEMGTPLNVVSGRAKMIVTGEVEGQEAVENARIIVEQSGRITNIIRQLLDFARRRDPQKVLIDMRMSAAQTLSLLKPMAQKNGVNLSMEGGSEPVEVKADPSQIQQTLMNLVINGIQAMVKGGALTLGFRQERRKPPAEPDRPETPYLVIDVRDEGEGIPPENIQKIFDPFFTTKGVGEGTGLGLSVAFGIVKEHGGWIDVESEVGKGSCFRVYLPREESHE